MPDSHGPTRRVLIGGYYGHGNLGDEAVLRATITELRRSVPELGVTVVSGDVAETAETHGVDAVHERDWPALVAAARQSDAVVLGGGGLFQDHFGLDPRTLLARNHWGLTYFAAFPALAALVHRPFFLHAVGVGPLGSEAGRHYTRLIFERADLATVRDAASLDVLATCSVDTSRVTLAADPAFLLEGASAERGLGLLRAAGVSASGGPLVALACRCWTSGPPSAQWQARVADALDRLVDSSSARLVFVPLQATSEDALTDDRAAARRIVAHMRCASHATVLASTPSPPDALSLFAACDLVVAMRLHGVLFGATASTPLVALAYDPKVTAAMEQLGLAGYLVELPNADAHVLFERMTAALAARSALRAHLVAITPPLADRARAGVEAIAEKLAQEPGVGRPLSEEWSSLLHDGLLERLATAIPSTPPPLAEPPEPRVPVAISSSGDLASQLEERTRELIRLGAELSSAKALLARQPGYQYRQLKRSMRSFVRETGRALSRFLTTALRPVSWLAVTVFGYLVPLSARRAMGRWLRRGLMSRHEYMFDLFKRQRIATYSRSFAALRTAAEPGLVSVVLPAYNGSTLMRESIESVLAQTHTRFELVIVDDGSTDDTLAIAREYAGLDSRVRVVAQEHRRLPATLSHGFHVARGEFLTWTSCDNRMKPDCLERLVSCLERHPDWDMAYANLDLIGADGQALRNTTYYDRCQRPARSEHIYLPESTSELNVRANNTIGAAFLYRGRVPALLGDYSPHRFVMEDYDYWMRVNAFLTLRHADFDAPIYDYRFHTQSLTSRWDEFDMLGNRERLMVFDDVRRDVGLSPMLWIIDAEASAIATSLERCIRAAGHVVYAGGFELSPVPESSVPLVYVKVVRDLAQASDQRQDVPAHALRVLVADSSALPPAVDEAWDLCVAVGQAALLPHLSRPYQGWLGAPDAATLFGAIDVRAKSAHLARVEARAEAGDDPSLRASVVICTRVFSERLREAIQSVARQHFDVDAYKLIVVDNDPEHDAVRIGIEGLRQEMFSGRADALRLVACPVAGLSSARNAGLAAARGHVVCFLDDDASAEPDWLAQVCRAFEQHPEVGVVGGHIRLKVPTPRPDALRRGWEQYWSEYVTEFTEFTEVDDWRKFPWGANWSARRDVLRRIGGFRLRYGRVGANFWGGEELAAACLARRLGFGIAVAPRAVVTHNVAPSRFTLAHVRRTISAGRLVGYLAERDGYLPWSGGLSALLGRAFTVRLDRVVSPLSARLMDAVFWKLAYGRVLWLAGADVVRRWRRPISSVR